MTLETQPLSVIGLCENVSSQALELLPLLQEALPLMKEAQEQLCLKAVLDHILGVEAFAAPAQQANIGSPFSQDILI